MQNSDIVYLRVWTGCLCLPTKICTQNWLVPDQAAPPAKLTVTDLMYGLLQLVWSVKKIEAIGSPKEMESGARDGRKNRGARQGKERRSVRDRGIRQGGNKDMWRDLWGSTESVRKTKRRRRRKRWYEGTGPRRKRGRKKEMDKEGQTEREMIRFLSPLYGSGGELPFQSNQAQAKVNNQSW